MGAVAPNNKNDLKLDCGNRFKNAVFCLGTTASLTRVFVNDVLTVRSSVRTPCRIHHMWGRV